MESPSVVDYIELESGEHSLKKRLIGYILRWWRQTTRYGWLSSDLARRNLAFPVCFIFCCVWFADDAFGFLFCGIGFKALLIDLCIFAAVFVAIYLIPRTSLWFDTFVCSAVFVGAWFYSRNIQILEETTAVQYAYWCLYGCFFLFLIGIHTAFIAVGVTTYYIAAVVVLDYDIVAQFFVLGVADLVFYFLPLMILAEYRCAEAAAQIAWAESILQNARQQQQWAFDEAGLDSLASLGKLQNRSEMEIVKGENLATHSGVNVVPIMPCSSRKRFIDEAGDCHTELSVYSASILSYDSVLQQILHDACTVKFMEPLLTEQIAEDVLLEAKYIWDLVGAQGSYERRRAAARSCVQRLNWLAIEELRETFDSFMPLAEEVVARRENLDQQRSFENAYADMGERLRQDALSAQMVFRSSGVLQKIKIYAPLDIPLYIVCDMLGSPRLRPHLGKFGRLQGLLTRAAISAQIGDELATRI